MPDTLHRILSTAVDRYTGNPIEQSRTASMSVKILVYESLLSVLHRSVFPSVEYAGEKDWSLSIHLTTHGIIIVGVRVLHKTTSTQGHYLLYGDCVRLTKMLPFILTTLTLFTLHTATAVLPCVSLGALMFFTVPGDPPWASTNSVQQQGSAALLAMRYLQEKYGHIFSFDYSILPGDGTATDQISLDINAADITGRFYYRNNARASGNQPDAMALLSPCT